MLNLIIFAHILLNRETGVQECDATMSGNDLMLVITIISIFIW